MTEGVSDGTWPTQSLRAIPALRPVIVALATLAVMFSLARGLRFPSFWAASAAQVDCSSGFVKRCALGEVARLAHFPVWEYYALAGLSFVALCVALAALTWNARSMWSSVPGKLTALAFACSFALAYYVNLIGYYDIPLTIVTVGALAAAERGRIWPLAVLTVVGLLVHELYLLTFLPVTLVPLLLDRKPAWRSIFAIGALASAITVLMALQRPMSPEAANALYLKAKAATDFPIREDYFYVFRWSLKSNLHLMRMLAYPEQYWRDMIVWGAVMVAPVLALSTWLIGWGWREIPRWRRALIGCAIAAPLVMNAIGLDASRWYVLVVINALIVLGLLFRRYGPPKVEAKPLIAAALAASCIGLSTQVRFIDDMPPAVIDAAPFRLPIWQPPMPKAEARALFKRSKVIDRTLNTEQP